ncbi:MAG: hypothetical protein GY870_00635 [archaeon]|nr:hypothetical protein [archaeon]
MSSLVIFTAIIPVLLDLENLNAEIPEWPENIDQIDHLEYFLEFTPSYDEFSTTNYSMELENFEYNGNKMINISTSYENSDLTYSETNLNYNISLDTLKINNTSENIYNNSMVGCKTELFCNTTQAKMGFNQSFRIDETLIFARYIKSSDDDNSGFKKIEIEFNYVGIEDYTRNMKNTINSYHYQGNFSWIVEKCT